MTSIMKNGEVPTINGKVSEAQEKILLEAYTYITQVPVSDIWAKITKAITYWLNVPEDKFQVIDSNSQMFNNANLLLDDIQNEADTREGIPTAHVTFGIPNALNAYYYASAISSANILDLNHPKAIGLYREQLMDSCRARRIAVYWRDTVTCPTEEEYKNMLIKRTSSLLTIVIKLMQLFSENQTDLTKITGLFGIYLHILEDYQRLKSNTDPESKTYAEDVTQGNFTFPIIHAINSDQEDGEVILEILRKRTKDVELKKYVIALLERHGSFDYTLKKLEEVKEEIIKEAKKIGKNPLLDDLIKKELKVSIT